MRGLDILFILFFLWDSLPFMQIQGTAKPYILILFQLGGTGSFGIPRIRWDLHQGNSFYSTNIMSTGLQLSPSKTRQLQSSWRKMGYRWTGWRVLGSPTRERLQSSGTGYWLSFKLLFFLNVLAPTFTCRKTGKPLNNAIVWCDARNGVQVFLHVLAPLFQTLVAL